MNKFTQILILSVAILLGSCSEYVIVPQYVSVEKLNSLEAGMSKEAVSSALSVDPYDAYHSTENGCELYSFKYLHRYQVINPKNKNNRGALRNNVVVYEDENDALIYFENGLLRDLIVAGGKADHDFVAHLITTCNGPVSGCSDDGSCKYCPCDYYKNPNYNSNNECEEECLPVDNTAEVTVDTTDDCSLCDVIKGSNGNVTINVSTTAPWESSGQSNSNVTSASSNVISSSKTQGTPSNTGSSKKAQKLNKKIDKLKAELETSKQKDSKKGSTSKKTQLIEKSIENLEKAVSKL
jgi:hypothetical protein